MAQEDSMMDKIKEKGNEFRERLGMNGDQPHEESDNLGADDHEEISREMSDFEEAPSINQPTFGETPTGSVMEDEDDMAGAEDLSNEDTMGDGDYNAADHDERV